MLALGLAQGRQARPIRCISPGTWLAIWKIRSWLRWNFTSRPISIPGTGNGKKPGNQEYTELGEHDLNSGAVLKFIAKE